MADKFDVAAHIFRSPQLRSIVDEAAEFFNQTPAQPLPPVERFNGGGVYALYYLGNYELYAELSNLNKQAYHHPIYVGKAVPPGWRTGRIQSSVTPDLYRRLREHARSLQQADNLRDDEFQCRFVILNDVESDLVVPVEATLIRRHQPLWNVVVDGFGNHDPGKGRYNQAKSEWDVLHPGRAWAERLTGVAPQLENIVERVRSHLADLRLS